MDETKLLFSINTHLAFYIAQRYYGGLHYVWCSDFLTPWDDSGPPYLGVPPTSSPFHIAINFAWEVRGMDQHGLYIASNKRGLRRGAEAKHAQGVINDDTLGEILGIIDNAHPGEFQPFLYIIPVTDRIAALRESVRPTQRAHFTWCECLIPCLPRYCFRKTPYSPSLHNWR